MPRKTSAKHLTHNCLQLIQRDLVRLKKKQRLEALTEQEGRIVVAYMDALNRQYRTQKGEEEEAKDKVTDIPSDKLEQIVLNDERRKANKRERALAKAQEDGGARGEEAAGGPESENSADLRPVSATLG